MVILDVYSKNIKVIYKSTFLSKATFLVILFGIFTIVLPFIFAYKTKGFWLKRDMFIEQPNVKFKGEYILIATTNNNSSPITCSSLPFYKKKLEKFDTCATIKVREFDYNFDNLVDQLDLSFFINLPNMNHLTSLTLVVPVDYRLHRSCSFHMQSAIIYQNFLSIPLSKLVVIGDLGIRQTTPIQCPHKDIESPYNYSIIINENELKSYKIENIIVEYMKRNLSTVLTNSLSTFTIGKGNIFNLELILRYPEHSIQYRPSFWQIMKWAWIQYLSIFVLVFWLVNKLKTYLFDKRIILFYVDDPIKKCK